MLNKTFKEYIFDIFTLYSDKNGTYNYIMSRLPLFSAYYQDYKNAGGTEIVLFQLQQSQPVKQRRILNAA